MQSDSRCKTTRGRPEHINLHSAYVLETTEQIVEVRGETGLQTRASVVTLIQVRNIKVDI